MVKVVGGFSVWLLIGASFTILFFYALAYEPQCESQQFCATTIFFMVLVGSLVMIVLLAIISSMKGRGATPAIIMFFMKDWTLKKLLYIPAGLAGVFGVAFLGGAWGGALGNALGISYLGPLIAIGSAGVILLICLYRTQAIAIPITIHGIYNAVVVASQSAPSGSFISSFASLPISVPHLGLTLGSITLGPLNEIMFQIFLVAVAEEVFKVFIIDFLIVGMKGKFDVKSSIRTWFAGAVAVLVWTLYHTINAIH